MPRTTRLAPSRCPWCGHELDAATDPEGDATPSAGDCTICIACGKWCIFDAGLRPQKPTAAEMAEIAGKPECTLLRAAWLASQAAVGHG